MVSANDKNIGATSGFLLQAGQLALLLFVAHVYLIEQTFGLTRLLPVIFIGFVIHARLPAIWRGPFFVLLFPISAVVLLGPLAAAMLILSAAGLFMICHLPVSLRWRVVLLVGLALAAAAVRMGAIEVPHPRLQEYLRSQTLPILAAMFMFRAVIYLYDLRHEKANPSVWQRLSYFFLFPNVCFPLFPVIDYQTFKRTWFDRNPNEIYQKGIDWILRGITHLLLYRLVYHYLVPDPLAIQGLAGVAQYALTSFLLYLRVSGIFHLIIGILCLFGYNLPETHHRYYLAESFTDFWRRINIYWKDFMVKVFYFPLFVALRRWGVTTAMIAATLITFFVTWLLHSYQWFWLRGTFPLFPQDMIFWGILAVLVTVNSLWEEKYGRKRRALKGGKTPSLGEALGRSIRTVTVFVVICLLWSFWTSASIDEWLFVMKVARDAPAPELVAALLVLVLAVATGVLIQVIGGQEPVKRESARTHIGFRSARVGIAALLLLSVSSPLLNEALDPRLTNVVATITGDQLNTRDQQQLVKGYYEELLGPESVGKMVWNVGVEPDTWRWNGQSEALYTTFLDDMRYSLLKPNIDTYDKHERFTTNQWGMRDRRHDKAKSPDSYRIAMLGSSYTVGAGVEMTKTFPALLEHQLNAMNDSHGRIEVLNFAQSGHSILRRQAIFQKNVLEFDIDMVIDMSVAAEDFLAVTNLRAAIKDEIADMDPTLLEIIRRAGVTPDMSGDVIDARLGPFKGEILRWSYRELARAAEQRNVKIIVFLLPTLRSTEAGYRQKWEQLSDILGDLGITAIDLRGVYGAPEEIDSLALALWDWHPNADGHQLIARRVFEELMALDYLAARRTVDRTLEPGEHNE